MSRNYKIFTTCILILFITIFTSLNYNVNADMGPKPAITINLENMNTKKYLIDLLVYDESGENYLSPLVYNGNKGGSYNSTLERNNLQTITISKSTQKISYSKDTEIPKENKAIVIYGIIGIHSIENSHYLIVITEHKEITKFLSHKFYRVEKYEIIDSVISIEQRFAPRE